AVAARFAAELRDAPMGRRLGRMISFNGLVIEARGPDARMGELCEVDASGGAAPVLAEVVGFREERVQLMPFAHLGGISTDSRIRATGRPVAVPVGPSLLGRVVNAFGQPLDSAGPLRADRTCPLYREPINPMARAPIEEVLETGIRAIDSMLTFGVGQRV